MALPKLPKSSITGAVFTRGGSLIGGAQLIPELDLPLAPDGAVVQNPERVRQVASVSARSGGFGPRSRAAYRQYNDPSINPRSQAPGAPISNRPLVPIDDPRSPGGFHGANDRPARGANEGGPRTGLPSRPSIDFGPPAASMASSGGTAFRGASLGGSVSQPAPMRTSVSSGIRAASFKAAPVAAAKTAIAAKPTVTPKATNAVLTTPTKKSTKKPVIRMA